MPINILDDQRRSKLLNTMLQGMVFITILGTLTVVTQGQVSEPDRYSIYLGFTVMMSGLFFVYLCNRWGSSMLASWLFLSLIILVLVVSDTPLEIVRGRTLLMFAIPVFAASILLPAYTSFVFAGFSSILITAIALAGGLPINEFAVIGLFTMALLAWLSSRSLEQALVELRHRNAALVASEQEKEILLKEVHHRVKNNLQIISSLLDLQRDFVQDTAMRALFQESRNRVRAMALIHEHLYHSHDMAQIDFADYVQSLLYEMRHTYTQPVSLQMDLVPLWLTVDTAVPLGLILNELLTNAYKHAFSSPGPKQLAVQLQLADAEVKLTIKDNGVGLPTDFNWRKSGSLGLTIVQTLVQQLKAQILFEHEQGTAVTLTLSLAKQVNHELATTNLANQA